MLETTDPKEHKALGRKVKNFDDKIWNESKSSTSLLLSSIP